MSPLPEQPEGYVETPPPTLPAAPPPELSAAIAAALQRAEALARSGRELDFAVGPAGDLRIEVRDLRGGAAEVIGATEALAMMGGLEQV